MFGSAKNLGYGLLGGFFDGQPGAFSQHQGGLRGLLGSFNDGQAGNALFGGRPNPAPMPQQPAAAPVDPWQAMVGMGEARPMPASQAAITPRPQGEPTFREGLMRALFPATTQARADIRKEREVEQRRQAMAAALSGSMGEKGFDANAMLRSLAEAGVPLGLEDITSLDKAGRPEYEMFGDEEGDQYRYDPRTGKTEKVFDYVDPYGDLKRRRLQAEIDYFGARSDYNEAKARQPYAPQRPTGGGGGNSAALAAIEAELRRRGKL